MGLTEAKIKDLEDKDFDALYKRHEQAWLDMVRSAFEFCKEHITNGSDPRPDDILKELLPMLEVNEDLREHQEENHARYKHYREYFGDYIIDKFISGEEEG